MKSIIERAGQLGGRAQRTVPGKVVVKFLADNGPGQAVLIAWNALFSLFPMLLAMAAVLGLVLRFIGYRSTAVYAVALQLVPVGSMGDTVKALDSVRTQTGLFAIVGLIGLVWSGSGLFGAMEQAFDLIFHSKSRDFIHQKLMAVGMMLLFTLLAGVAILSSAVLPFLGRIPAVPGSISQGATIYVVQPLMGIISGVLLFGSMYYVVPNRKQRLREVWPGALLAGLAFYALTLLFPLYIHFNRGLNQYGAGFALIFVIMNFFYFVGLITMFGIELNAVLYPIPIAQPDNAARLAPSPESRPPARRAPAKRLPEAPSRSASGIRTAVFGVVGAGIGLLAVARRRRRGS